ncbi:hypothetical protein MRX96_025247 [Rhipicephalus microplus]
MHLAHLHPLAFTVDSDGCGARNGVTLQTATRMAATADIIAAPAGQMDFIPEMAVIPRMIVRGASFIWDARIRLSLDLYTGSLELHLRAGEK